MAYQNEILFQPAYVLHTRAYRDTSLLVDLFTHDHGRFRAIARSVKRPRSPKKGLLQPGIPLRISFYGKNELKTISEVENNGHVAFLTGKALLSGFYLNELLIKLWPQHDPNPKLFTHYATTLPALTEPTTREIHLRQFEKYLLRELGYALPFSQITDPQQTYRYDPHHGFLPETRSNNTAHLFQGEHLLAFADAHYTIDSLNTAKRLMRFALQHLLGNRRLSTRDLYVKA